VWGIIAAAVATAVTGIMAGSNAVEVFGSKDPGAFVMDEVAGMLISGLAAWTPWNRCAWATLAIAFFWFRVTDILKPPPARQLEHLPRGWGIVMDDVAAGVQALVLTIASLVLLNRLLG
jgi:phosphatidylglycerophosphatase A